MQTGFKIALAVLLAGVVAQSCKVDDRYKIDDIDATLDKSITVFGEGITIPLGKTKQIRVDSLLNLAGEDVNKFFAAGIDGSYAIVMEDSYDLGDQLSEFDLSALSGIDAISFNESFDYKIGDFDADNLTIDGNTYSSSISFDEADAMSNISISPINEHRDIDAGISGISAGDKLSLTAPSFNKTFTLIDKSSVQSYVEPFGTSETPVPLSSILPANVEVEGANPTLSISNISLDSKIGSISDVKFSESSKLNINVRLYECFLTQGTVTPTISIDLSSILKIKDVAGPIVLSKPLNTSNSWSSSYTYSIEGLAQSSFAGNSISINETVPVSGSLAITDAYTTGKKFVSCGNVQAAIEISIDELRIASATVALAEPIVCNPTTVDVPVDFGPFDIPDLIKSIEVIMNEDNPLSLSLSADGLSSIPGLNIRPEISVTFPEGLEVDGMDADRKIVFSGNLADGTLSRQIKMKSFSITPSEGKVEYHGNVAISASAVADGSFDIADISSDDITLSASIIGTPAVADYKIGIDPVEQLIEYNEDCSFEIPGIGSIGTFSVYPENPDTKILLNLSIPSITGVDIATKPEGLKAVFPDFVVFKDLDPSLNYNASDNSITIIGALPDLVTLPVEKLSITPVAKGDSYEVPGQISISGTILASPTAADGTINKAALDDISCKDIGMIATVPTITAQRIEMDGDFEFQIDQELEEMTFLSADSIPEQLVSISEIALDDVFANVSIDVRNLPRLGDSKFILNLDIELPEMVNPSKFTISRELSCDADGSIHTDISEQIISLKDIDFSTGEDIKGKVSIKGAIKAENPLIEDIALLKSEINCDIVGSIGNDEGKIAITRATGRIDYTIDSDIDIDLSTMPEQLKGENVNLDILPELTLSMTTNLGIPVSGRLVITPYVGDEAIEKNKVVIDNVELPYSADGKEVTKGFFIAADASAKCPAGYTAISQNLSSIVRQIPDRITVSIQAGVDPERDCIVTPDVAYTAAIDYKLNIPFEFGENFKVSFEQDIDMSNSDIEEIADFTDAVALVGTITNTTPLDFDLDVRFIDANEAEVNIGGNHKIKIAACGADGSPVETPLNFTFSDIKGSGLDKVSAIRLVFNLTARPDVILNKEDYLQVVLSLSLPEGVTIDIN